MVPAIDYGLPAAVVRMKARAFAREMMAYQKAVAEYRDEIKKQMNDTQDAIDRGGFMVLPEGEGRGFQS